jgi:hypothetical protein
MDCAEFRRRLGAEPLNQDPAFLQHAAGCAECAALLGGATHFEQRLASALDVAVPGELADRVMARVWQEPGAERGVSDTRAKRRRPRWNRWAQAVGVLLVVAGTWWGVWNHGHSLPAYAVAHVPGGEGASLALTQPISVAAVDAGFAGRGLALRGPVPADVTYVHDCDVGPYKAVHLVMRMDGMPVTVLYFPNKRDVPRKDFVRGGWHGREVPTSDGAMVLLADNARPFDVVEAAWRAAIDGPAATAAGSR